MYNFLLSNFSNFSSNFSALVKKNKKFKFLEALIKKRLRNIDLVSVHKIDKLRFYAILYYLYIYIYL